MMLATWLVEIYLSKCNDLDDVVASESVSHDISDLQAERTIIEDDLRQFLETFKVSHHIRISLQKTFLNGTKTALDKKTIYELIQSHGRTDIYLFYATIVGDFQRVIEHWILEEDWLKALEIISRQVLCHCHFKLIFVTL